MGLETTATHAIWLVAILTAAGIGADALLEVEPEVREARAQAHRAAGLALHARASGAIFCHDAVDDRVSVRARNAGDAPIDSRNVSFLVDGRVRTGWTVSVDGVEGAGEWRPGELAWFNLTEATEPDRVTAHTQEGLAIFPTKTTCPRLTTIVVSPSSASVLTTGAQTFTATGYDQFGEPFPGVTYTWEASRGTITQAGEFTAPTTAGATVVYANASGVSGSASVAVTANVHVVAIDTYKAGVPSTSFARGDTVEVRVTLRDQAGNAVPDATVSVQFTHPPNSQLAHTGEDATDASGVANVLYTLLNSERRDTWTVTVSGVTGDHLTYVPGSNLETSDTFQVS